MESNIIYRITKGNEQAFEKFMDYYSTPLYHYVFSIIRNKETSEEILSDVFIEVWKQRTSLLEIENLRGWLYTVAFRKAVSALRHEATIPTHINVDEADNFKLVSLETTDERLIKQEEVERLHQVVDELPPKCKHVFFLAKIEKLPYKEISKILDISVPTINYHISYAMAFLKKKIKKE